LLYFGEFSEHPLVCVEWVKVDLLALSLSSRSLFEIIQTPYSLSWTSYQHCIPGTEDNSLLTQES
jgi:hypothetical protein